MALLPAGIVTAWHNSGAFWAETWTAAVRHPLVVLACGLVPAAERAYMLLETRPIPPWRLALLEALLTLWRILICVAMVWAALGPQRWALTRTQMSGNVSAQVALQKLGAYIGNHLHVVLWELFLFVAAFLLLNYMLVLASRATIPAAPAGQRNRRRAFVSVARNLVLVPLALIYLVELLAQKVY